MCGLFSVHVGGIPGEVHWRWLKSFFAKHLKVADVYMSKPQKPANLRFGFVRFGSKSEALEAIDLFNGCWFRGFRLKMSLAKESGRQQFWRRVRKPPVGKNGIGLDGDSFANAIVPVSFNEAQSFGLKSCSAEVIPDVESPSRDVWLAVSGLPVRFWSEQSFGNLAKLWGVLLNMDRRTVSKQDLSSAFIQIRCNFSYRIDESVAIICNGVPIATHVLEVPSDLESLYSDRASPSPRSPSEVVVGSGIVSDEGNVEGSEGTLLVEFSAINAPVSVTGRALDPADQPLIDFQSQSNSGRKGCENVKHAMPPFNANSNVKHGVPTFNASPTFNANSNCIDNKAKMVLMGPSDENLESDEEFLVDQAIPVPDSYTLSSSAVSFNAKNCWADDALAHKDLINMGMDQYVDLDDDPFGLMEIITKMNGVKKKSKKHPVLVSEVKAGFQLDWVSYNHVAMVEFGPSDANLDDDCDILPINSVPPMFQSRSKLFNVSISVNQDRTNSKFSRPKKGSYRIFGNLSNDRAKACMYAGKIRRKRA